jgi:hypothetical protein
MRYFVDLFILTNGNNANIIFTFSRKMDFCNGVVSWLLLIPRVV